MIAVIDYGIGNLGSAHKSLVRIGAETILLDRPDFSGTIDGVILPGVGSFGACMAALRSKRLDTVVLEAVRTGLPVLGICVGMQMLYQGSEESPGVAGLGLLDGLVRRISGAVKLPHIAWDPLSFRDDAGGTGLFDGIPRDSWFYFVHSYAPVISEDTVAACEFGDGFCAVAVRNNVMGTQFHPEKSSSSGLALLSNFAGICGQKGV